MLQTLMAIAGLMLAIPSSTLDCLHLYREVKTSGTQFNRTLLLRVGRISAWLILMATSTILLVKAKHLPGDTKALAQQHKDLPAGVPAAQRGIVAPLPDSDPRLQLNTSELHKKMRMEYWFEQYDHYYPGEKGRPVSQQKLNWVNMQLRREGIEEHLHFRKQLEPTPKASVRCAPGDFSFHDNVTDNAEGALKLSGSAADCAEIYGNKSTNIRGKAFDIDSNRVEQPISSSPKARDAR